ncbi:MULTISPECIES: DUF418 domain-containing protein [Fictibacillus]|uniref:DUF418 domain-containing protein n=1 Tax=Fictibacillus TaxID=1329200 RepID=UPI001E63EB86|nr:DUF418 domain-containing protein [Fictibacillus sp. 26RED30]
MNPHTQSNAEKKRAISLDVARGFMLLLIVLAHAPLFLYESDPGVMSRPDSLSALESIFNSAGELFIDNRARPLFAVLFGYGMVMMYESQLSKGKSSNIARKTINRRSLYLILFGIVLAVVVGGQDILMAYGIAGLLTSRLLMYNNKVLAKVTVSLTIVFILYIPVIWGFFLKEIGSYGFGNEFSSDQSYSQLFLETIIYFPTIPVLIHFLFPILPSVLIGIWMGRIRLLTESHKYTRELKMITLVGISISLIGSIPLVLIDEVWKPSLFTAGNIYGFQIITGIAGGFGYAALFGLFGSQIKKQGLLTNSLIALGKRSLTFYVLNETLLVLLLSPAAFGLGGELSIISVTGLAFLIWLTGIYMASLLEKYQLNGPLETLIRYLVYR